MCKENEDRRWSAEIGGEYWGKKNVRSMKRNEEEWSGMNDVRCVCHILTRGKMVIEDKQTIAGKAQGTW